MNFLRPKNIFATFFPHYMLNGKRFISYHVKFQMTPILRLFQYKILNNILYLNKQLFIFDENDTKLCSYCRLQTETINHIFVKCKFAIKLWSDLRNCCQCSFDIPILNPQSATFGFFKIDLDLAIILNHILLLYKNYIFSSRDSSKLSFAALLKNVQKVFALEKKLSRNERKTKAFIEKWCKMIQLGNFMN